MIESRPLWLQDTPEGDALRERLSWAFMANTLKECQKIIEADGSSHSWLGVALQIAKRRAAEAPVEEQAPDKLASMEEHNHWDHLSEVMPVLRAAKDGEWSWFKNGRCKYINLRIDMRSFHCTVRDRDDVRISVDTLKYQGLQDSIPATNRQKKSR